MKCRECAADYSRPLRYAVADGWDTRADEHGEFILCPDCLAKRRAAVKPADRRINTTKGFSYGT